MFQVLQKVFCHVKKLWLVVPVVTINSKKNDSEKIIHTGKNYLHVETATRSLSFQDIIAFVPITRHSYKSFNRNQMKESTQTLHA